MKRQELGQRSRGIAVPGGGQGRVEQVLTLDRKHRHDLAECFETGGGGVGPADRQQRLHVFDARRNVAGMKFCQRPQRRGAPGTRSRAGRIGVERRECVQRPAVRWVRFQPPLQLRARRIRLLGREQDIGEDQPHVGIVRIEVERTAHRRPGVVQTSHPQIRDAQVGESRRLARSHPHQPLELGGRVQEPVLLEVRKANRLDCQEFRNVGRCVPAGRQQRARQHTRERQCGSAPVRCRAKCCHLCPGLSWTVTNSPADTGPIRVVLPPPGQTVTMLSAAPASPRPKISGWSDDWER